MMMTTSNNNEDVVVGFLKNHDCNQVIILLHVTGVGMTSGSITSLNSKDFPTGKDSSVSSLAVLPF